MCFEYRRPTSIATKSDGNRVGWAVCHSAWDTWQRRRKAQPILHSDRSCPEYLPDVHILSSEIHLETLHQPIQKPSASRCELLSVGNPVPPKNGDSGLLSHRQTPLVHKVVAALASRAKDISLGWMEKSHTCDKCSWSCRVCQIVYSFPSSAQFHQRLAAKFRIVQPHIQRFHFHSS